MTSHPSHRPVSARRARMIEDMNVRGFREKTRNDYVRNVRAMQGPSNEAVAEIRQAIGTYRATGTRLHGTHHLTLLAQAAATCGHCGEGLAALREARRW
jgi:hypothetical protein